MRTIENSKVELKLWHTPLRVKTKREMTFSKSENPCVIPEGTELDIYFSEVRPGRVYFDYAGSLRAAITANGYKNFTKFQKEPGLKSLERMAFDGVAKTVTGYRTEPDGYGKDGSPSWLLVLGHI